MKEFRKISEWFDMLNEPERSSALKNCKDPDQSSSSLAYALLYGLEWGATTEGIGYWEDIYIRALKGQYVHTANFEKRLDAIDAKLDEQLRRMEEAIKRIASNNNVELDGVEAVWKDILDNFDWEKVRKCMVVTGWRWASVGGVPTVGELQAEAKGLVEDVYGRKGFASAGGFQAEYFDSSVNLSFVLTSWSADD